MAVMRAVLTAALITLTMLGLTSPGAVATSRPGSANAAADRYLERSLDRLGADGGAWALVEDGQVTHRGVTGSDGDGDPVGPDTPFLLGSVSKPILATLVMTLAAQGRVDPDSRVADVLPSLTDVAGADEITARQLMAHTSGLPFGADELDKTGERRTPASVVDDLAGIELSSAPGETYEYSSLGYVVLTAWLEETTGSTLADLVAEHLPLTGLQADPVQVDVPPGRRGPVLPAMDTPIDPAGAGYGYSSGSIETLAQLAATAMRDADRLARMTDVRPAKGETLTGLGWRVSEDERGRRVWHTGMVPGYFTAVHMLPGQDKAVVFAVNRSGGLVQQQLYDASIGVLDAWRSGDEGQGTLARPWTEWGAVVVVALLGALAVLLERRAGAVRWLGMTLGLVLLAGPVLVPRLMGFPDDYAWLWMPELVVVLLASGTISLLAVAPRHRAVAAGGHRGRSVGA